MTIAFHAASEKETEEVADYYDLELPISHACDLIQMTYCATVMFG